MRCWTKSQSYDLSQPIISLDCRFYASAVQYFSNPDALATCRSEFDFRTSLSSPVHRPVYLVFFQARNTGLRVSENEVRITWKMCIYSNLGNDTQVLHVFVLLAFHFCQLCL